MRTNTILNKEDREKLFRLYEDKRKQEAQTPMKFYHVTLRASAGIEYIHSELGKQGVQLDKVKYLGFTDISVDDNNQRNMRKHIFVQGNSGDVTLVSAQLQALNKGIKTAIINELYGRDAIESAYSIGMFLMNKYWSEQERPIVLAYVESELKKKGHGVQGWKS